MARTKPLACVEHILDTLGSQKQGFIYFVTPIFKLDVVKIGFSTDPHGRLFDMQGGNAELLDLVDWFPAKWSVEKRVHQRFDHLRILREWFRYDEEIRDYLEDLHEAESEGMPLRF